MPMVGTQLPRMRPAGTLKLKQHGSNAAQQTHGREANVVQHVSHGKGVPSSLQILSWRHFVFSCFSEPNSLAT